RADPGEGELSPGRARGVSGGPDAGGEVRAEEPAGGARVQEPGGGGPGHGRLLLPGGDSSEGDVVLRAANADRGPDDQDDGAGGREGAGHGCGRRGGGEARRDEGGGAAGGVAREDG